MRIQIERLNIEKIRLESFSKEKQFKLQKENAVLQLKLAQVQRVLSAQLGKRSVIDDQERSPDNTEEFDGQHAEFEILDELHAKIINSEAQIVELKRELTLKIRETEHLLNLNTTLKTQLEMDVNTNEHR